MVGRIVPFDHPVMFATARTAAALMAGNSVVLKPPETSSLSALILSEIASHVLPPGVFNIVTRTGATAGGALARHPAVKRIAFIGSVPTGLAIQLMAAETGVKHVSLELGGKNPLIAFPDGVALHQHGQGRGCQACCRGRAAEWRILPARLLDSAHAVCGCSAGNDPRARR